MKTTLMGFARRDQRRARTQARRLVAILKQYQTDPASNYSLRSEAAALARRVSGRIRRAEDIDRVILTDRGERRQVFVSHLVLNSFRIATGGHHEHEYPNPRPVCAAAG